MRILLIYAHPVEGSFSSHLRDVALQALEQSGHQVQITDLYAENFPPALSRQERLNYDNTDANMADISTHVERLRWAEGLVLVFPTWWYGMPAILKGYFDRVWVPGVAFELGASAGALRPRLQHIRVLAVVTTYGAPWWFNRLFMGDPCRRVLKRGLAALLSPKARRIYLAQYGMDKATEESRRRFSAKVERTLGSL